MSGGVDVSRDPMRDWLARAAGFLVFWLILAGFEPVSLLVGALAAVIAAGTSLQLLPRGDGVSVFLRWRSLCAASCVNRSARESMSHGVLSTLDRPCARAS
jgi:hypothetical protein